MTDFGDFVLKTIFVLMMILHKDKDDYQARSPLRRQVHDWTRQSGPPQPTPCRFIISFRCSSDILGILQHHIFFASKASFGKWYRTLVYIGALLIDYNYWPCILCMYLCPVVSRYFQKILGDFGIPCTMYILCFDPKMDTNNCHWRHP